VLENRVARLFIFIPKIIPTICNFYGHLVYFTAFCFTYFTAIRYL
jgi:hypothetical protein